MLTAQMNITTML